MIQQSRYNGAALHLICCSFSLNHNSQRAYHEIYLAIVVQCDIAALKCLSLRNDRAIHGQLVSFKSPSLPSYASALCMRIERVDSATFACRFARRTAAHTISHSPAHALEKLALRVAAPPALRHLYTNPARSRVESSSMGSGRRGCRPRIEAVPPTVEQVCG